MPRQYAGMKRIVSISLTALSFTGFAAPTASASQVGTASPTVAAAQLRHGMPSTYTGAWARAALPKLAVKPNVSMIGYNRALFPHWRDASTYGWPTAPNNACNARNAALYREGTGVKMSSKCTNLTGRWTDAYGSGIYNSAADIDIDHVVPLGNAWASGARFWSPAKKTAFANDPLVLVAVKDSLNSSKSDKSPDKWMPPNAAAACNYAERWVAVKTKYKLNVTTAERTKLTTVLRSCA